MRTATLLLLALPVSLFAQNGPSHHWPLDGLGGTIAYDIAGGSNGYMQNGASLQANGYFGEACGFDGADDRIDIGPCDITTGTGGFSISLWVKLGLMAGSEQVLMAKTNGPANTDYIWSLSQVASTAICFRVNTNGTVTQISTSGSSIFGGAWYHLAATYDGAAMSIYVNGALMTTAPKTGMIPYAPMSPATMGGRVDGQHSYMGLIDDARLYDHALSASEIIDIVLGGVSTGMPEHTEIWLANDGTIQFPQDSWQLTRIIDLRGRTIQERNGEGIPDLRDEPSGLYLVCLREGEREVVRPLLKP